ncbi:alpha/beta fold hydrolase [Subtercola sp. YIM 133946]|uniref:alpha/beta fold hydrolase n=1 Tax=Subtercola sp. YIM 133946 TaxID=3118909 RepID=UPI002F95F911
MNVILVPGFWLGAWSWSPVTAALFDAGHAVHPLTLPGMTSVDDDRRGIGLADHIAAVVAAIDELPQGDDADIVLIGHSGGGPISYAASDQRPDRVRQVVYVDSGPLANGLAINPDIPEIDGELLLPPWEFFDTDDLAGLTPQLLDEFRANAVPEPSGVARDGIVISDDPRRLGIRSTVISTTMSPDQLNHYAAEGVPFLVELPRLTDCTVLALPTGHWPQFSRPDELAELIVASVGA